MDSVRIVLFTDIFLPSIDGVTISLKLLCKGFTAAGHEVLLVSPTKPAEPEPELEGVEIYKVTSVDSLIYPDFRLALLSPKLWVRLRQFDADIIHVATPGPLGVTGLMYAEMTGRACVGAFHTYFMKPEYLRIIGITHGADTISKFLWQVSRRIFDRFDAVISPSKTVKADLLTHDFSDNITVIPNPIDVEIPQTNTAFAKEFLKEYQLEDRQLLLYIGRLSKEKNLDQLLAVSKQVFSRQPETRLVIIGDGPHRAELEVLAQELAISDNVIFAGKIPHQLLLSSGLPGYGSVFVSCSTSEVQPMSFIEAAYFGLPLVLADTVQNRECLEENGVAVDHNNTEAFAEAITTVLTQPKLRQQYSQASKEFAKKRVLSDIVRTHLQLYRSLLK